MEDLLRLVLEEGASDLHLTVGVPPILRLRGSLVRLDVPALTHEDTAALAKSIVTDSQMRRFEEEGGLDLAVSYREHARFRVSLYRQRGHLALALRLIPVDLMTPEEIGIPSAMLSLIRMPRGLILVTGPTGSGKTTTLASLINVINSESAHHIITIEDPIEYYHPHKSGIVNQREVGNDVPSFAEALRRALRQDPDVILVGEMRDLETMQIAMTAAETGHLVFSTLHTTGAGRTVDRIVDSFPQEQQETVRVQLAGNLRAVLSQILLPTKDGESRVAAFELMINNPSIGTLIRDNKTFRISSDIQTGAKHGMVSLEASLVDLYRRGLISLEQVMGKAQDPEVAKQLLQPAGTR